MKYDYDYMTCRWLLESSLVPGTRTNFVTFTSELRDLRYWHVENLMYWCIFVWRIFHWLINVFIWFVVRVDLYAFDKFWIKQFLCTLFRVFLNCTAMNNIILYLTTGLFLNQQLKIHDLIANGSMSISRSVTESLKSPKIH